MLAQKGTTKPQKRKRQRTIFPLDYESPFSLKHNRKHRKRSSTTRSSQHNSVYIAANTTMLPISRCEKDNNALNTRKSSTVSLSKYFDQVRCDEKLEMYCPGCKTKRKLSEFRVETRDTETRKDIPFMRCRKCRALICLDPYTGLRSSPKTVRYILRHSSQASTTVKIRKNLRGRRARSTILKIKRRFAKMLFDYAFSCLKPKNIGTTIVMDDMRVDLTREYGGYDPDAGGFTYAERKWWLCNLFDAETGMWIGWGCSSDRGEASMKAGDFASKFTGVLPKISPRYDGCLSHKKALMKYIPLDRHDSKTKRENVAQSNEAEGPHGALRKMGIKVRRFRGPAALLDEIMLDWFIYNYTPSFHEDEEGEEIPGQRAGVPFPNLEPYRLLEYWIQQAYIYKISKGQYFHRRKNYRDVDTGSGKSRYYQAQFSDF